MDSIEEMRNETKEYPFSRFISDVGGSLGLFMGISAATVVGIFELIIVFLCRVSTLSSIKHFIMAVLIFVTDVIYQKF